jgi:hypothetical protein
MRAAFFLLIVCSFGSMAQTRLKSCIGCGGSSTNTENYYARSTIAQVTVIDCKEANHVNYLTGFSFQAVNRTGIQTDEITVTIFPNPAIEYLNIEGNIEGSIIKIVDLSGKEIQAIKGECKNFISTSAWNSGIYFLQIQDNNRVKTFKIIKI